MKVLKDKGVEGKVIVCTGAAGVLCSSMTEDLLRHGAKVAVLDLRKDVAEKFVKGLAKKGLKNAIAVEANVLDKSSLEQAKKAVLKKWGRIDVLINGAGGNHPKGTTPAEAAAKVDEAKKAVEEAKAEVKGCKNEVADKIQSNINECKEKIAAKREAKDKKDWEDYIVSLIEYAEDCETVSVLFEAEAILAAAMAGAELYDYIEKYGDEA